ncbi:hypothetical protein S7711_04664 [Stachybotrys chartarum IBT 7711]|uniref:GH18 domain-containing protein n=1 Tax=Stachybotrys chartarum (strain CBS 109288 / IBT 7711) TaxID=1280523 RepID=A0A084B621_STACB|nr:hypothetical protein S7711_04664 [Stachybotrys chartarum IBT 7711]KFA55665.1 hypothetical protein S40293_05276 [Stachybotrys chartarum IBT 40293]
MTKAGVLSGKVVVGVSSYGRSFKMITAGCDRLTCVFTGTNRISSAAKGRCTAAGGYISNAEISEIVGYGRVTKQWKAAGSNALVYDSTQWVSYMDEDLRSTRTAFYNSYTFAGTTDWAVDLQKFWPSTGSGGGGGGIDDGDSGGENLDENYPPCTGIYSTDSDVGLGSKIPNTTYIMEDENGFFEDILEECGIEKGWIKFGRIRTRTPNGRQYTEEDSAITSRGGAHTGISSGKPNFLIGLLFFIPAIGGAIGGAAPAPLRGIPSLIGSVGEAGLLVYSIIEDPDGAFMAVFAALVVAGLGSGGFGKAVDSRRDMTSAEIRSLDSVEDRLDSINGLRQATCRAR